MYTQMCTRRWSFRPADSRLTVIRESAHSARWPLLLFEFSLNSWSRQVGQEEAKAARLPAGGMTWGSTSVGDFHWEEISPPPVPAAGPVSRSH